jgi:hypothetical protein
MNLYLLSNTDFKDYDMGFGTFIADDMASEKNKDVKTTEYENKFSFPHY